MKKIVFIALFTVGFASAQVKLPSRSTVKKEVKEEISSSNSGSNTKKEEKTKSDSSTNVEETNSPAKGQINVFWKHIEKMRNHTNETNKQVVFSSGIQSAKMSLNNTKSKDPNYDTTHMEKALAECQEVYNGLAGGKENLRQTRNETASKSEVLLKKPFLFEKGYINIGGDNVENRVFANEKIKESNAVIEDYKNQVNAFLSSNPEKVMYQNDLKSVVIKANSVDLAIKFAADVYKNYRTVASVTAFQDLILYKNFIECMKKVFPNEPSLTTNLVKVNNAIQEFGMHDKFMDKLESNQKAYVSNLKMGKSVINDATLEARAKKQYESAKMNSRPYTVTKVAIVSDWKLIKNDFDLPLYKQVYVNFAIKFSDGKCGIAVGWMNQDYEGGGRYSEANLQNPGNIQEIPCENLK